MKALEKYGTYIRLLCLSAAIGIVSTSCSDRAKEAIHVEPFGTPNPKVLDEGWHIRSSNGVSETGEALSLPAYEAEGWYPASVPCSVLTALVENAELPDPYYNDNLSSFAGFVPNRIFRPFPLIMPDESPYYPSWWYRTVFEVPSAYQGTNVFLQLDGINYRANVWLNGNKIADDQDVVGMFRRFTFQVSDKVVVGSPNCLALEITAPGHDPSLDNGSKQIEATIGWDDHNPTPPDMNMGIWRDVILSSIRGVEIKNPYVRTDLDLPSLDVADLKISMEVVNHSDQQVTGRLQGEMEALSFTQSVSLSPYEKKLVVFDSSGYPGLRIQNPRVWWPNNLGLQELYDLKLRVIVNDSMTDEENVRFGIREVNTYMNDNGWRVYQVNGRKFQVRGGAWMNVDMLLDLTDKRYEAMVEYARNANFNMLRSEGFTVRETDEFYNLCDEKGIFVTQQLFGRSIADENLALACIEDTILRIRNHPSLIHFLGHDETFPTDTLDQGYRRLIEEYTPERTYQPHSGAFDVEDRFETGGTRTGSLELWMFAYPGRYYENREDKIYATGFAQSGGIGGIFCHIESARRFIPEEDIWPWYASRPFSFHTVAQGSLYYFAVYRALRNRYGPPNDVEDFFRKGMVMNYECARAMFEAYGRNKGYSGEGATGITTWKYNAAWPAVLSWQYVDWYLVPTGAYYGAKKACEPIHVQYAYDDASIHVVNACREGWSGLKVSARGYDFDLRQIYANEAIIDVGPDGKEKVFTIAWPADVKTTMSRFLLLELMDQDGMSITENFYWLSKREDIPFGEKEWMFFLGQRSYMNHEQLQTLPKADLVLTATMEEQDRVKVIVSNPTDRLAFYVQVDLRENPGGAIVSPVYWTDNHFSLMPGRSKTVYGRCSGDIAGEESPVVSVEGWNVDRAEYGIK